MVKKIPRSVFCASEKSLNFWNIRNFLKIIYRKSRKSIENSKNFYMAQIDSKKYEKIHDYLR